MTTETNVQNLIINKLTQAQYEEIASPSDTELYLTPDESVTSESVDTIWTGTKAQYDAIAVKDSNTIYNITDDADVSIPILELLFPVGSVYIGTMSVCPLQTLGVGTWQLVAKDRVLQGAGTRGNVGTTLNESLPNITGSIGIASFIKNSSSSSLTNIRKSGVFNGSFGEFLNTEPTSSGDSWFSRGTMDFKASNGSSTYQDNAPVQQDAYLVNIWERIS